MCFILPFFFWEFKIFNLGGVQYILFLSTDAGIVERDGVTGLYRGFVPNALKTLPNSRYAFILLHHFSFMLDKFLNMVSHFV